jgi:hypothetical protein
MMVGSTRPSLLGETPLVVLLGELNAMEARDCLGQTTGCGLGGGL